MKRVQPALTHLNVCSCLFDYVESCWNRKQRSPSLSSGSSMSNKFKHCKGQSQREADRRVATMRIYFNAPSPTTGRVEAGDRTSGFTILLCWLLCQRVMLSVTQDFVRFRTTWFNFWPERALKGVVLLGLTAEECAWPLFWALYHCSLAYKCPALPETSLFLSSVRVIGLA